MAKTTVIDETGRRKTLWQPFPFRAYCACYQSQLDKVEPLALSLGVKVTCLDPLTDESFDHKPVALLEFSTPDAVGSFRDHMFKNFGIKLLSADIKYGTNMIIDLGLEQDPAQEAHLCYIDIETDPRKRSSITEMDKAEARVLSVSIRDRNGNETWICEDNEEELFEKTKLELRKYASTSSWSDFDMGYLLSRAKKLGINPGSLTLPALDLMNLYSNIVKRSTGGRLFVSLEQACKECKIDMKDLGVKKDITLVWTYFEKDRAKLHEYNAEDTRAIFEIDKQLLLTASRFKLTEMFNMPLKATQYNSHIIDIVALRLARQSKPRIWLPSKPVTFMTKEEREKPMGGKFKGALVIEPTPGIKEWVGVFDFAALYPNIIKSLNIGMETQDPDGKYLSPTVHYNDKPDSIPRRIVKLADAWKAEANRLYDAAMPGTMEKFKAMSVKRASKVLLVSLYGVLGSPVCRMFDIPVAESIALSGRAVISEMKRYIEEKGWIAIYGDTDSIFVTLKSKTLEGCLEESKLLTGLLNQRIQWYCRSDMGADDVTLEIELDQIYDRILVGRGAKKENVKKRYAGHCVWEKQKCDYVYIVGFEVVRRDWTVLAHELQKYVLDEVLKVGGTQDEVKKRITPYVDQLKLDLYSGKLDKKLLFWRALPRPIEEYQGVKKGKGIPPQVRVAIQLREKGLFEQRTPFSYVVTDDKSTVIPVIQDQIPTILPTGYDYYWRGQVLAILHRLGFDFEQPKDESGKKRKARRVKNNTTLTSFAGRAATRRQVLEFFAEARHVSLPLDSLSEEDQER